MRAHCAFKLNAYQKRRGFDSVVILILISLIRVFNNNIVMCIWLAKLLADIKRHKWNDFHCNGSGIIKVKWLINHCNSLHFTSHSLKIADKISLDNQIREKNAQTSSKPKKKLCVFLIVRFYFRIFFVYSQALKFIFALKDHIFIKLSNLFIEFISMLPYLVAYHSHLKAEVQT